MVDETGQDGISEVKDEIVITSEMIERGVNEMKGHYLELIDDPHLYHLIVRNVLVKILGEKRISFPS